MAAKTAAFTGNIINYKIFNRSQVRIEIFNCQGVKIKTLVDMVLMSGLHQVEWDAKDTSGNAVASGVYFVQISVGIHTQICKLLLVH